jgi:uncharacterized protein (DUF1800 family)
MSMLEASETTWTLNEAAHLLNRAGFGGSPDEIRGFHALGRAKAVDSLFTAKDPAGSFALPEWATMERAVADMRGRIMQRREARKAMRDLSPEEAGEVRRESFKQMQEENRRHALEAQAWWFRRMLTTACPLREKMTLFWHDHFATSIQKVKQPVLMVIQNELFRSHALGSFKTLTHGILMDPAMLLYLDTQSSRKGKPNENFAREVMELFTLGEGNYTEQDIREAARAFTGYQLDRRSGKVVHGRSQWDGSDKTIFGKTGPFTGADVIDLIFAKPEVARMMARKLWEFFVYENPGDAAVDGLASILRGEDYRIEPALRALFLSREFYSETAIRNQIKSPVQFLIGMFKQLEIGEPSPGFPITAQQQLGQILFMPPNVAGWDWGKAWINTNTLLTRYNLAGVLTKGAENDGAAMREMRAKVKGFANVGKRAAREWSGPDYEKVAPRTLREKPSDLVDSLVFRFFQGPLPGKAGSAFLEYATAKQGVVFTDKEVAELCHLMLSTPYYQLC